MPATQTSTAKRQAVEAYCRAVREGDREAATSAARHLLPGMWPSLNGYAADRETYLHCKAKLDEISATPQQERDEALAQAEQELLAAERAWHDAQSRYEQAQRKTKELRAAARGRPGKLKEISSVIGPAPFVGAALHDELAAVGVQAPTVGKLAGDSDE